MKKDLYVRTLSFACLALLHIWVHQIKKQVVIDGKNPKNIHI
jgi:hypothetical protein